MKFNSAFPQPLPKECDKAARIFSSFVNRKNNGLDGVIPRSILQNAKGFAIFTVFKAGFMFSARGGSGVVIAKLSDGNWSAPSAIGCGGFGAGCQIGAELTDFLIVLNSASAVKSFMSAGSLTLGGNLSVAVGPLGRNGEAIGSVSTKGSVAAMYSYSKTRGLFGGVSVEGSVIMERQDANALAYHRNLSVKELLSGIVPCPEWAGTLVTTLQRCTRVPTTENWTDNQPSQGPHSFRNSVSSLGRSTAPASSYDKKRGIEWPPKDWGLGSESGSRSRAVSMPVPAPPTAPRPGLASRETADPFASDSEQEPAPPPGSYASPPFIQPKAELLAPLSPQEGIMRAIALYDYQAVESGDLSFSKGDVIVVTKMSDQKEDWWTGKVKGAQGIFPANFVELVDD